MDREAWWATVHRVSQSQARLKQLGTHVKMDSILYKALSGGLPTSSSLRIPKQMSSNLMGFPPGLCFSLSPRGTGFG